jgi:cytochrome P450
MRRLRPMFEREAAKLIDRAVAKGTIDGVTDIAKAFIVEVLPNAVGLAPEGRENLLPYGDMVFNGFGPRNDVFEAATRKMAPVTDYIMRCCERRELTADGLGAQVYAAVDAGEISETEALFIVRSLLGAGLDTTVDAIGNALHCFATHPDQWETLRREPVRMRNAIEEVLRYDSPFQIFFRTTTRPVEIGGVRIGADEKVMISIGSANRDPAKWAEPERFDIARDTSGHIGFGLGIHNCLGQAIARLEMQILFTELARRVARIEVCGPAPRRLNNTLHGFATLPLTLHAA